MSNIIPMNYDDRSFPFTADCWFNATVAAKHHGKLPKDWLKTEATKIYIAELAEELGIAGSGVKEDFSPLLVRVEKGRNGGTMNNRIVECASRAGRDFSEFMKGEKNMMEALRSAEEFTEQLRIHGCVNHHLVNFMMMKAIMKVFDDLRREELREERRRKREEKKK